MATLVFGTINAWATIRKEWRETPAADLEADKKRAWEEIRLEKEALAKKEADLERREEDFFAS